MYQARNFPGQTFSRDCRQRVAERCSTGKLVETPRVISRNFEAETTLATWDVGRRTRSVTIRNFPVLYTLRMGTGKVPAPEDGNTRSNFEPPSLFHASRTKLTGSGKLVDTLSTLPRERRLWKASTVPLCASSNYSSKGIQLTYVYSRLVKLWRNF